MVNSEKEAQKQDSSPPGRGELRRLNTIRKWGGLLSSGQNPEECDATGLIVALQPGQFKKLTFTAYTVGYGY